MKIKSSTTLRNDYNSISTLAHQTNEPIFITKNGEGDLVVLSIEAYEEREAIFKHRESILEAELARLSGEKTYNLDEVAERLNDIYKA